MAGLILERGDFCVDVVALGLQAGELVVPIVDFISAVVAHLVDLPAVEHRLQIGNFLIDGRKLVLQPLDLLLVPGGAFGFRIGRGLGSGFGRFGVGRVESGNHGVGVQVADVFVGPDLFFRLSG